MHSPQTRAPDVICYGEALALIAATTPVSLAEGPLCQLFPAGAEFNVAAHLAALGVHASWVGALGQDPFGTLILNEAAQREVDTAWVHTDPERPTGVYFKSVEHGGTSIYYYRSDSAASVLDAASLFRKLPARPSLVHTSGITAALSPVSLQSTRDLVTKRIFPHSAVSFDVNFRRPLWSPEEAAETLLELCQAADIVFVGRDEAERVWGAATAGEIRDLIDRPHHLIVKDGAIEATEFTRESITVCPAPRVRVLEEVGAGDAFAAGWLSVFLRGRSAPEQRLRTGHLLASQALQRPGDLFTMPNRGLIERASRISPLEWPKEILGSPVPNEYLGRK